MYRGLVQYYTKKLCIKDIENILNEKDLKDNLQNFKKLLFLTTTGNMKQQVELHYRNTDQPM